MMRQFLQILVALIALLIAPLHANEPDALPQRIVAVGDLHGDYDAWKEIAQAAGLTDRKGRWTGGQTILVQLGDITDRGPDSLKIIRNLQELERQAADAGGQVVVLMGNHEAMNVTGDLRYVHPGEYEAFRDRRSKARREATWEASRERILAHYLEGDPELTPQAIRKMWFARTPLGMLEHRRAWAPTGELGAWTATLPPIAKVGDTLFVHGGLSEEVTREPLKAVNRSYQGALAVGEEVDRSVLTNPLGPLWYRGNVYREGVAAEPSSEDPAETPQRPTREEELALVLERYGASRLVVGHTPSVRGIKADLGGRLIRADTGISAHYRGPRSYVTIENGEAFGHQRQEDGGWAITPLPLAAAREEARP